MPKKNEMSVVPTPDLEKDQDLQMSIQTITEIEVKAQEMTIATVADRDHGAEALSVVKSLSKEIEDRRKAFVTPFNDVVKGVNAKFRPYTDRLEAVERVIKSKLNKFIQDQAEAARKEQARIEKENAKKMAAFEKKVEAGKVAAPPVLNTATVQVEKKFATAGGAKVHMVKTRKFEVLDISAVPMEYHRIDEVMIGKLVRNGIPSIPGIRIWEEESISAGRTY